MKIQIAKSAGFCWGVKLAIEKALSSINKTHSRIYTFGPLIHNQDVINELSEFDIITIPQQVQEVEKLYKKNNNKKINLLIRSHGISPDLRKEISQYANIFDATCPKVAKVQSFIKQYSYKNYFIIIIGDKNHAEVNGLEGFVKNNTQKYIISNENELHTFLDKLNNISKNYNKFLIISQTTQNIELFKKYSNKIKDQIKALFNNTNIEPDIKILNTICEATFSRQNEIKEKAKNYDLIFIVGGRHSANTNRLYNIAKQINPNTYFIQNLKELKQLIKQNSKILNSNNNILIQGGASTPLKTLVSIRNYLYNNSSSKLLKFFNIAYIIIALWVLYFLFLSQFNLKSIISIIDLSIVYLTFKSLSQKAIAYKQDKIFIPKLSTTILLLINISAIFSIFIFYKISAIFLIISEIFLYILLRKQYILNEKLYYKFMFLILMSVFLIGGSI